MTSSRPDRPRVLVVEDDAFTRTTLCGALRGSGVNVVADTGSATQALGLASRHEPHVALLDLDLGPGPSGIDVAIALRESLPAIGIVVLTGYSDPRLTGRNVEALPGGALYLTKGELSSAAVLARALDTSMRLASDPRASAVSVHPRPKGPTAGLTSTQVQVARMVADGLSNAEIAARRGVSPATIERIIQRISRELGIDTTSATNRRVLIAREFLRQGPPRGGT